jgi:hypothetical protein
VQHHILEILITDSWVRAEAVNRGVRAAEQEIDRVIDREFPTRSEFRGFLAIIGARAADERFLILNKLLLKKLQSPVSPLRSHVGPESAQMAAQVDLAIAEFGRDLKKKWIPRTNCRAGYVVPVCRQYARPKTS